MHKVLMAFVVAGQTVPAISSTVWPATTKATLASALSLPSGQCVRSSRNICAAHSAAFAPHMTSLLKLGSPLLCPASKYCAPRLGRLAFNRDIGVRTLRPGVQRLSCSSNNRDKDNWSTQWTSLVLAAAVLLGASSFKGLGVATPFNLPFNTVEMVAAKQITSPSSAPVDIEISDRKLEPSEKNTIRLFRENTPSVVFISTFVDAQNRFTLDVEQVPQGTGSGFVWDKEGHIVTNFHVIRSATAASVALTDDSGKQTVFKARLVGVDPDKDTAVLKIDAPPQDLRPIIRGRSSDLQVGQTALAIGNPFGLDHSLTIGVLSGLGRETKSPSGRTISNVIQTDAAINPGNSGGPLLDSQGALIGMNTAIYSPSGASSGVGFAIPVDTVSAVVNRLISNGAVMRPALGITILDASKVGGLGLRGVLILETPPGSPAAKAGLKGTYRTADGIALGDVVVALNNDLIGSEVDLFSSLEKYKPGDVVTVTVRRGRADGSFARIAVELRLAAAPPPALN